MFGNILGLPIAIPSPKLLTAKSVCRIVRCSVESKLTQARGLSKREIVGLADRDPGEERGRRSWLELCGYREAWKTEGRDDGEQQIQCE